MFWVLILIFVLLTFLKNITLKNLSMAILLFVVLFVAGYAIVKTMSLQRDAENIDAEHRPEPEEGESDADDTEPEPIPEPEPATEPVPKPVAKPVAKPQPDTASRADLSAEKSPRDFYGSVAALLDKKQHVPEAMRPVLQAIADSSKNILRCMETDPRDVVPGERFLRRYLQVTHDVVDKYAMLSHEPIVNDDIRMVLLKSEEALVRLQGTFAKEHEALLKNDVADLSADLTTLDMLLKMKGQ